jgi:hypothetical protein
MEWVTLPVASAPTSIVLRVAMEKTNINAVKISSVKYFLAVLTS